MKTKLLVIILFCVFCVSSAAAFESLDQINSTNWAKYFEDWLGFLYDSHGCLHFSPADIYLLYQTIPAGTPLKIKSYNLGRADPPFPLDLIPDLNEITVSAQDLEKHARIFKNYQTEILAYPSLNRLFILVNHSPYAQVKLLAGPPYAYLMAYNVEKGKPVDWDFMLTTPTDAGEYKIFRLTDHYLSSAYYKNTIVPFGAWIVLHKGKWIYQKGDKWHRLPSQLAADLEKPPEKRIYNYYDASSTAARWAGHDFGKYVMLWSKDGKSHYPEMGYAAGELVFEQIILVKDLVHILTLNGPDDFEDCVSQNKDFTFYKGLSEFVGSDGKIEPPEVEPKYLSYYKLYNGLELTARDYEQIDDRLLKAYKEFKENRLPRDDSARSRTLGLYQYLRFLSQTIKKQAYWYEKLKHDWESFKKLRRAVRKDFSKMGILSLENRQNILEEWFTDRLEFGEAKLPKQARYAGELSFSAFFKPEEKASIFTRREREIMRILIEKRQISLRSVQALNEYNFGRLLDEILGDLYKSHGCLHVSPRNSYFLFEALPAGTLVKVHTYTEILSAEAVQNVPALSGMVNFWEDLVDLKEKLAVTAEVKVEVYPKSGIWLVYLKNQPFCKLSVKGGPQAKMYLLQLRDEKGRPVFEDHFAYPTSPGDFKIFKKTENYISNIYYETSLIPQGGLLKKEKNSWIFKEAAGNWRPVPKMVEMDLKSPAKERKYTYYDQVEESGGEVVALRWGSHPFGKYALQTSLDNKGPWPELIHSSGDLIMEQRQLINDLILVLSAPFDDLEKCVKYSDNFDLYEACYKFVQDPDRTDLIQTKERAYFRLYFDLPLSSFEVSALPKDALLARKIAKGQELAPKEIDILIKAGIAERSRGKLKINLEKIMGLQFDAYQYVVAILKFSHHYETLVRHWQELSSLRRALLEDFNDFAIKNPVLFQNFMRELMLQRVELKRLSQEAALKILEGMF